MKKLILISGLTIFSMYFLLEMKSNRQENFEHVNKYVSFEDTLYLPFDTNRVIQLIPYKTSSFAQEIPNDLDTFDLSDLMYACDCPGWATKNMLALSENERSELISKGKEEIYYIERGDKSLEVPDLISLNQNIIRFYGKVESEKRLPKEGLMDPSPPIGKVLVYYGYELLYPAIIRGPEVFIPDTTKGKPEWAMFEPTYLVLKNKNYLRPKTRSR